MGHCGDGAIVGFDANGARIPGSPTSPRRASSSTTSDCAQGDTGCQSWIEPPRHGTPRPRLLARDRHGADKGGRITVLNPRRQDPVGLADHAPARWGQVRDSVTIGENRDRIRRRRSNPSRATNQPLDPRVRAKRHARLVSTDRRTVDAGTLAARTPGKHSEVFTGRICQTAHWCVRFGRDRPCLWAGPGSVGRAAPSPSRDRPRPMNRRSLEVVAHA